MARLAGASRTNATPRAGVSISGTVLSYDDQAGLGWIDVDVAEPANILATYPFHCASLLDGTRTTSVGERVVFQVRFGPLGWEAMGIQKVRTAKAP